LIISGCFVFLHQLYFVRLSKERYLKHLSAHEIDPNETKLGRWLECDTENECFTGNDNAHKLARGSHRKPYLINL
jgi:hypothetical protein